MYHAIVLFQNPKTPKPQNPKTPKPLFNQLIQSHELMNDRGLLWSRVKLSRCVCLGFLQNIVKSVIWCFVIFKDIPSHLSSFIWKTHSVVESQWWISSAVGVHLGVLEVFASHVGIFTCTVSLKINHVHSFVVASLVVWNAKFWPVMVELSSETRSWRIGVAHVAPFPVFTDLSTPEIFLTNARAIFVFVISGVAVDWSWMKIGFSVRSC